MTDWRSEFYVSELDSRALSEERSDEGVGS